MKALQLRAMIFSLIVGATICAAVAIGGHAPQQAPPSSGEPSAEIEQYLQWHREVTTGH